jgi:hypothetical protein
MHQEHIFIYLRGMSMARRHPNVRDAPFSALYEVMSSGNFTGKITVLC